ncbi:MAG TPA: DUF1570 domain-containing protein [Lacipirellulaceae bacterium]|nr:DUF1570 domain-containing protein [Lacipirellulaceae bacterium]
MSAVRATILLVVVPLAACAVGAYATEKQANKTPISGTAADSSARDAETLTFRIKGQTQSVRGRVVVEAADGGILFQGVDGELWTVERNEIEGRERLGVPFKPLTPAELSTQLLGELPPGFRSYTTPHYVVCYNTSREYAQWTSSLLERLYKAFSSYWQKQGLEVHEPEFPLPVVVFAERPVYDQASRDDLPNGTGSIIGYYSLRSNRINMFDLTGTEAVRDAAGGHRQNVGQLGYLQTRGRQSVGTNRRGSLREINQMLSQPAAVPLVATIVHEATHQIAFNCGLQTRYADIPLWLCEGMAVYFEAPDLASKSGWRGIGRVNYPRLETFRKNVSRWHEGSLEEMIRDSRRFRDPRTAVDAYADAWALNYYLIKFEAKEYAAYLKMMAAKKPLVDDDPQTRLSDFRKYFGDLHRLQHDFLKQMSRVR